MPKIEGEEVANSDHEGDIVKKKALSEMCDWMEVSLVSW